MRFLSEHFASGFRRGGDYDCDGDVDTNDYDAWKTAFGSMTQLAADGNEDRVVDAADYVVWRKHVSAMGVAGAGGTAGSLYGNPTVPEPAALVLAVVGILGLVFRSAWSRGGRALNATGSSPSTGSRAVTLLAWCGLGSWFFQLVTFVTRHEIQPL